jgi:MraZ protein
MRVNIIGKKKLWKKFIIHFIVREWEKVLFCVRKCFSRTFAPIMTGFLGEYEATLDAKGRFLLPAGFKKQLAESAGEQFVINRGFEKCLSLYPMSEWQPIFERISKLNDFDPKVREFRRYFLNGATICELDSAGRLLVPKNLMTYASLEKNIVLAAATNKIEIWDQVKYQEFFENFSPGAFSDLAQQVMGGGDNNISI